MKYLIVLSLIAAVASAGYIKPTPVASDVAEIQEIIAAINSPSTDPATAAALEQLLLETLGIAQEPAPIATGPTLIDFPLPDGGAVTAEEPTPAAVDPSPAAVVPAPAVVAESGTPLVQIILNINSASSGGVVAGAPAAAVPVEAVDPVQVVDQAINHPSVVPTPVQVVDSAPEPVQVVDSAPEPVQVVDSAPEPVQVVEGVPAPVVVAPEPIQIGEPIIPEPIVLLPDTLN